MCKKIFVFLVFAVFTFQFLSAQVGVTVGKEPAVKKPADVKVPEITVPKKQIAEKPADVYDMLKSKETSKRRSAVDAIGKKKNPADAPVLIQALSDPDSGVKIAACDALGLMREQAATDKIILLLDDNEPQVRQSACVALGYIGDPKAKPELIKRVNKDTSDSVRTQAILILGNMRSAEAVDSLIPLLEDKNPDVQLLSAQALGKIEDPKAAPAVKKCLTNSISKLKDETDSFKIGQYKRLISEAAKTSGKLKDNSAESELKELLNNDDKSIKLAAAGALGQIGNKSGLEVANELLKDENSMIRTQAVQTLGAIGDPSAIPALEKMLGNEKDRNVMEAARSALYRCGWKPPKIKPVEKKK